MRALLHLGGIRAEEQRGLRDDLPVHDRDAHRKVMALHAPAPVFGIGRRAEDIKMVQGWITLRRAVLHLEQHLLKRHDIQRLVHAAMAQGTLQQRDRQVLLVRLHLLQWQPRALHRHEVPVLAFGVREVELRGFQLVGIQGFQETRGGFGHRFLRRVGVGPWCLEGDGQPGEAKNEQAAGEERVHGDLSGGRKEAAVPHPGGPRLGVGQGDAVKADGMGRSEW